MIGSLLYLCASRPDMMRSVCMCAHFHVVPKESHHQAIKRILIYLAHTTTLGLWYPEGAQFNLVGYLDSDYVGDQVDRKSTSGTCHFLGRSLVCWSNCVSLSTAEAEYIAAGSCCAQLLWMKQTLKDYDVNVKNVSTVSMRVPSRLLITQFITRRQSTFRFVIIFFVNMC